MFLILGLGNPGQKYQKTRHNIGFRVVEELKKSGNLPNFQFSKRERTELLSGFFQGKEILLAKPQTFMNVSGSTARILSDNYNIEKKNILIIHDDIDLPLGKIKISKGKGSAGHKGVESIIKHLGTEDFIRFRIGTKPKLGKPKNTEKFVLQKFSKEEEGILKEVVEKTCLAIEVFLKEGLERAMAEFNK